MSDDQRSRRMVAVINCILNHNARAPRVARYPGMNMDVVEVLNRYDVGVIQMPCPEMVFMGLPRVEDPNASILEILDTPEGRACCERLAGTVVDEIEEYRRNGYTVAAILGGDVKSPGCAVPCPATDNPGDWGLFIQALQKELSGRDIDIPIRGIRDSAQETMAEDLSWLEGVLAADNGPH